MEIFLKTLKGTIFAIEVKPTDTVADVKKTIETTKGADTYPAAQQVLINQGKVLKDGLTLKENEVLGHIIILLRKNKGSPSEGSTSSNAPTLKVPQTSAPPPASTKVDTSPPAVDPAPALIPSSDALSDMLQQAVSNLVASNNLEVAIQQILYMGGGTWDRDTVVRALCDALNNPERAVEYMKFGIPVSSEAPPTSRGMSSGQAANVPAQSRQPAEPAPLPSTGPNAIPLDLFPQDRLPSVGSNAAGANALNFPGHIPRVQSPQLLRSPQENQADFPRMIDVRIESEEGALQVHLSGTIPQYIRVTPQESESIERLKAMGFDEDLVIAVFFACDKNEELAAHYLLDHIHESQ